MKVNIIKIIENYFNNEIDLWDLVDEITYASKVSMIDLKNATEYLEKIDSDEAMIVTLLLWLIPNSPFKKISKSTNAFFKLLFSIEPPYSDFFKQNIVWHYLDNEELVLEKGIYLIMINAKSSEISLQLPDDFANKTLYCHNCNEEFIGDYFLKVPEKSFYILTKNE